MIDLNQKIEEIRQKPEHIRIRYVWGAVFVSMFFILLIWMFSIKESLRTSKDNDASSPISELKTNLEKPASGAASAISDIKESNAVLTEEITKQVEKGTESEVNTKTEDTAIEERPRE